MNKYLMCLFAFLTSSYLFAGGYTAPAGGGGGPTTLPLPPGATNYWNYPSSGTFVSGQGISASTITVTYGIYGGSGTFILGNPTILDIYGVAGGGDYGTPFFISSGVSGLYGVVAGGHASGAYAAGVRGRCTTSGSIPCYGGYFSAESGSPNDAAVYAEVAPDAFGGGGNGIYALYAVGQAHVTSSVTVSGAGLRVFNSITASSITVSSNTYLGTGTTVYALGGGISTPRIRWEDGTISTTATTSGGGGGSSGQTVLPLPGGATNYWNYPSSGTFVAGQGISGSTLTLTYANPSYTTGATPVTTASPALTIFGTNYSGTYAVPGLAFANGPTPTPVGLFGYTTTVTIGAESGGFIWVDSYGRQLMNFHTSRVDPDSARIGLHIGTGLGKNMLDVAGSVVIGSSFTTQGRREEVQTGVVGPVDGLAVQGNVAIGTFTATDSQFVINASTTNAYMLYASTATSGGNAVVITTNASVGIGVTSPYSKLHVIADSGAAGQIISESGSDLTNGGVLAGYPALQTLQTKDAALYYNLLYVNDSYGKVANYITGNASLTFDHYPPPGTVVSGYNSFLPYGGVTGASASADVAVGLYMQTDTIGSIGFIESFEDPLQNESVISLGADGNVAIGTSTLSSSQFFTNSQLFVNAYPTNTYMVYLSTATVGGNSVSISTSSEIRWGGDAGLSFASLGTPPNGTLKYCSDCTVTTAATCTTNLLASCVCAGSGTGAFAKRLNGTWYCN